MASVRQWEVGSLKLKPDVVWSMALSSLRLRIGRSFLTVRKASQPTGNTGGTNPVQMGSGVGVSGIVPNMSQWNIVNTGTSG